MKEGNNLFQPPNLTLSVDLKILEEWETLKTQNVVKNIKNQKCF